MTNRPTTIIDEYSQSINNISPELLRLIKSCELNIYACALSAMLKNPKYLSAGLGYLELNHSMFVGIGSHVIKAIRAVSDDNNNDYTPKDVKNYLNNEGAFSEPEIEVVINELEKFPEISFDDFRWISYVLYDGFERLKSTHPTNWRLDKWEQLNH